MNSTPLSILHTNMLRGWGGQSNRILMESLAVVRAGEGHSVELALPRGSELGRRARAAGLQVYDDFEFRGPGHPIAFLRDVRMLRRILRSKSWDILHLHGSPDTWTAALALRGIDRRPATLRTRHNIFPVAQHPLNAWLYGRHVDGIIAISNAIRAQCADIPFLARKPTAVIWSIPDLERFKLPTEGTRERLRAELLTPDNAPVVLCAARLRPEKGVDVLLRAVPALRAAIPDVRVWIAGDGSHRTEYETLARELDVLSATTFLGFRPDVPDLMTAADVAAIPSRSEGLGTAALEALAMGLPAVAANIGGLPDVVIHEQTGELVPPESPDSLARALARLLRAPQLRRDYAQRGRQLVAEHFTESALARKTIHFYRQLRSQRP